MDEAVGGLDLRPLVALEHVLDDQRMEAEDARDRLDPGRRRPGQVDPDTRVGLSEHRGQRLERRVAIEIMEASIESPRDRDAPGTFRRGRCPPASDGLTGRLSRWIRG